MLSRKPILFRLFTGITVKQFGDICKKIERKSEKYELQYLSKRKGRQRGMGAGRPFNLDLRNRFFMLLICFVA
jgi:hypothetical protein